MALGIQIASALFFAGQAVAAGFRTVGSSGCSVQMAFLPPYTDTVVFLDNYHANYGGPGVNLRTGEHSPNPYKQDDGSDLFVFGVEYSWRTNGLRKLIPQSNTFCAAGAFFPDGTMVNVAGAETYSGNVDVSKLKDGRQSLRRYKPGPCSGACKMDFEVNDNALQSRRWYPTAITLANGDVLVVGGSKAGLLVTNEASINNPTYELIKADGSQAPAQQALDILQFGDADNQNADKSYNLYPILQLLPDAQNQGNVFTMAGNQAIVHKYESNKRVKNLPNIPLGPRCFPGTAAAVMLPLSASDPYNPTVLVCGGSSADIPNPQTLNSCFRIKPNDPSPQWDRDDDLPNGGQTMTEPVILPDGTVLLINGAHTGSAGGYMADDPVNIPLLYDPSKPAGSRFSSLPTTNIPRLYHSVAILLPSGEVLIAGSNPDVFYNPYGNVSVNAAYPEFGNNGHTSYLHQQQRRDSSHPTEYRVEIFSPAYMDSEARPEIMSVPDAMKYGEAVEVAAKIGDAKNVQVRLSYSGFHTHAIDMGQRMVGLSFEVKGDMLSVTPPANPSIMPPGVYLLWVVEDGIPSEGKWVKLES